MRLSPHKRYFGLKETHRIKLVTERALPGTINKMKNKHEDEELTFVGAILKLRHVRT